MEKENTHKELWEEINELKSNHIAHLANEVTEIRTNVSWLIDNHKAMRTMLYSIIGGIILTIILIAFKLQ